MRAIYYYFEFFLYVVGTKIPVSRKLGSGHDNFVTLRVHMIDCFGTFKVLKVSCLLITYLFSLMFLSETN